MVNRERVVFLLFLCSACGGGGSTAPTPAVSAPTITTPNTTIFIGQTVQFQATGTGPITWGGDQPSVATVDAPTGRVTGAGIGTETIWAQNSGGRTTRLLNGLPSFAGNWSGNYVITGCQSTFDFTSIGFCGIYPVGTVLNMSLNINQTDAQVSGGTVALGTNVGVLNAATVDSSGLLPLTGTLGVGTVTIQLGNGRFQSQQAGVMTGTFDQNWSQTGATGFGIFSCQIRVMTRTSGGPSAFHPQPRSAALSLAEVLRGLRR